MTENLAARGEGLAGLVAQLTQVHPLPWRAESLMIRDARGAQVIHLGGSRDEFGRGIEGDWLVLLNKFIVAALEAAPAGTPDVFDFVGRKMATHLVETMQALEGFAEPFRAAGQSALEEFWFRATGHHIDWDSLAPEVRAEDLTAALATPSPQSPAPEVEAINDRAKVERALNALDHLCDMWAEEVDLERIVKAISGNPDKVRALLRQSWIEGAYRGRTSHVDYPQTVSSAATQEEPCGTAENVAISTNADTLPIARTAENSVGLLLPDAEWNSLSSESKDKLKKWFEIATEHLEQMLRPAATQQPAGSGASKPVRLEQPLGKLREIAGELNAASCVTGQKATAKLIRQCVDEIIDLTLYEKFGSPRKVGEDGALKEGDKVFVRGEVDYIDESSDGVWVGVKVSGHITTMEFAPSELARSVPVGEPQ